MRCNFGRRVEHGLCRALNFCSRVGIFAAISVEGLHTAFAELCISDEGYHECGAFMTKGLRDHTFGCPHALKGWLAGCLAVWLAGLLASWQAGSQQLKSLDPIPHSFQCNFNEN